MRKVQYSISWGFKFTAIRKIDTSKFTNPATRTLFSNDSTWRTHLQSLHPWRPAQSSANRPTNLHLQTKNSINRILAAKCTPCFTPDPISHNTQSRKSRNSPPIHRQFMKRWQKDLFDISTGLAISDSRTMEALGGML